MKSSSILNRLSKDLKSRFLGNLKMATLQVVYSAYIGHFSKRRVLPQDMYARDLQEKLDFVIVSALVSGLI